MVDETNEIKVALRQHHRRITMFSVSLLIPRRGKYDERITNWLWWFIVDYRSLTVKKWHPDRWTKDHFGSGEAKRRFQQIQEAYSVLSDRRKRSLYDVGLYDTEEDEGYFDFAGEMISLMSQTRREEKQYSLEELKTMVHDMVYEFQSEPLFQD
ncbi:DnaJ domain protein [Raphanus sativus]|nr:DnaJ domain protein [Raphanus sativus]